MPGTGSPCSRTFPVDGWHQVSVTALTQRALAAELGVTVRTLQNHEAGRFVPFRHLQRLEQLLETPPGRRRPSASDGGLNPLLARASTRGRGSTTTDNVSRPSLGELNRLGADQNEAALQVTTSRRM